MSAEELEVDIFQGMCLRCTVDTKSGQLKESSEFCFKGGRWNLRYYKFGKNYYCLDLCKCSGVSPNPLHVSVRVESFENGRNVNVLPWVTRFTDEFEEEDECYIWWKTEHEILRSVPQFNEHGVLKLIVVLKLEGVNVAVATQTEDFGVSHPVPTTTSTTVHPLASAARQSSGTASTSIETTLFLNIPGCLQSLLQDFSKMLDQGMDTDVEFQCGDHTIKAHGAVVSARSEVIGSMLSSDMVEGTTRVVKIPNMGHEAFKHFLRYIYTGQLPELTVDLALNLYESGDQYAVLGLAKRCSQYLQKHLTVQNSLEVLIVADAHANAELKEAVIDFMAVNRVPRVSDPWKDFSRAHPLLTIEVLDRFCTWLDQ